MFVGGKMVIFLSTLCRVHCTSVNDPSETADHSLIYFVSDRVAIAKIYEPAVVLF